MKAPDARIASGSSQLYVTLPRALLIAATASRCPAAFHRSHATAPVTIAIMTIALPAHSFTQNPQERHHEPGCLITAVLSRCVLPCQGADPSIIPPRSSFFNATGCPAQSITPSKPTPPVQDLPSCE